MSLYAIPGLMTSTTTPKASRHVTMSAGGIVNVVVWQSAASHFPVSVRIARRAPLGTYDIVFADYAGVHILRERTGAGFNYVFRLTPADVVLPAGDLEIWVATPENKRQVFYLSVPDVVVQDNRVALSSVTETPAENEFGLFDLPSGVSTVRINFPRMLNTSPTWAMVSIMDSQSNPVDAQVIIPSVSGYDRAGLNIVFSSAIPRVGLKLAWSVATKLAPAGINQFGQFSIPAGAQSYNLSFSTAFATAPVVFLTPQTTYNGQAGIMGYSLQQVTSTGFTVALTSPAEGNFLFNWQARV